MIWEHSKKESIVVQELLSQTKEQRIFWCNYNEFKNGISDNKKDYIWLFDYERHMLRTNHEINTSETYFALYKNLLFALSHHKYYDRIRLDFLTNPVTFSKWYGIIASQDALHQLLNAIKTSSISGEKSKVASAHNLQCNVG